MPQTDAEGTQYRGVGQVTLPARNRQFLRQMGHQGIGNAEVAFGIFEVNGVDFVRHGGRTDFARHDFLFEIPQ